MEYKELQRLGMGHKTLLKNHKKTQRWIRNYRIFREYNNKAR